jgi:NADH-quinone oxidoreductase subunit K
MYLYLGSILFIIGTCGIFLRPKYLMGILFAFEILILSIVINFIIGSIILDDILGQIYSILILSIAASESSIGLALLIQYYRLRGGISIDLIKLLKS